MSNQPKLYRYRLKLTAYTSVILMFPLQTFFFAKKTDPLCGSLKYARAIYTLFSTSVGYPADIRCEM